MTAPTNHWKLGLFVVVGVVCGFGALVWLGTRSFRKETVHYVSYFDESVTGLELGSPVSFRGVKIGDVSEINVAPDRRHVEINYELGVSVLTSLGLAERHGELVTMKVPDDVRVQVASSGVTGTKYLKLDFLPNSPVLELGFPVPENYIPASPSTMKSMEESLLRALDRFPLVVEKVLSVAERADAVLLGMQTAELPQRTAGLLASATRSVDAFERKVNAIDSAGLSQHAHQALGELNQVLTRADKMMARIDSEAGLLNSVQRASDSIGDVAANARGTGPKLDQTLEQVSEMAESMQRLLDALERDPDMLLKGHARSVE
jgi:phospholipid/cholesterol/gamma-HCH transport system substrate-binding protein